MSQSNTREEGSGKDYFQGWQELFRQVRAGKSLSGDERDCLFLNAGEQGFVSCSSVSGLDIEDDGRGVALVDWDQDGRLDAWISNRNGPRVRFLHNQLSPAGHHVAFRLQGSRSNRDGIGAAVTVRTAQGEATRWTKAGSGFLSQSSKWLHFGLGDAQRLESVSVRWPGGAEERFEGVRLDRRHVLVEGGGEAIVLPPRSTTSVLAPTPPPAPVDPEAVAQAEALASKRTVLAARLELPRIPYKALSGEERSLEESRGKPLLVSFWASWCAPCLEELEDWTAHADQLAAAGLDVLALNTDTINYRMIAARRLSRMSWPFRSGYALPQTMQLLDVLGQVTLESLGPVALPTSMLIDPEQRLVALYRGPVGTEQLLLDLATPGDAGAVRDAAAAFPGRWLGEPPPSAREELRERLVLLGLEGFLQAPSATTEPAPPTSPPEAPSAER